MLLENLRNLQRWTRKFAFWYFGCSFLLTNWTTFARNDFTFSMFLESDLLGLKHMMHASFVLGGVRALGSTGNRRYLEIVAAVTLLSSFPSFVATVLTSYHFMYNSIDILSNFVQVVVCLGMLVVTSFSAWYAIASLWYSEERTNSACGSENQLLKWLGTKTSLVAVSTLKARMDSACTMFEKTIGKERMKDWNKMKRSGYNVLYLEICFHLLTNIVFLSRRLQQYRQVKSLRVDETVGSLVESTSLALHWGFLLGNAFHGLRAYSPQCLDIFCWGKMLLVGAQLSHQWNVYRDDGGGSRGGGGGGGGLGLEWAMMEVCMHILTVIVIRRVRFSIGTSTPQHETMYSCHHGTLSAREEHGLSLWDAASQYYSSNASKSTRKNDRLFRWYWFGRSASMFSVGCFMTMAVQCSLLIVMSSSSKDTLRAYGVGVNFAIHAAAMCMLALYRPTRDRFAYEHSRAFNVGVCFLFCTMFVWQISCAWWSSGVHSKSDALVVRVYLFNAIRIFVYAACGSSFWLTPKHMPDLLMHAIRAPQEGPSKPTTTTTSVLVQHNDINDATQVDMFHPVSIDVGTVTVDERTPPHTSVWHRVSEFCISFSFVQWSSPKGIGVKYEKSNVKNLPLVLRGMVVEADRWTRIAFWLYILLGISLGASDGYWLGSHGTRPFVNIGCLTMPSQICFHYNFILTGYALKGLRSPHVPMLKLVCCCTIFVVMVTMVTALTMAYTSNWWIALQLVIIGSGLSRQVWTCWFASLTMTSNPRMFPKSGVSHNWM